MSELENRPLAVLVPSAILMLNTDIHKIKYREVGFKILFVSSLVFSFNLKKPNFAYLEVACYAVFPTLNPGTLMKSQ